jgi:Spy/CpxP family protein refolding chaperone
VESQLACSPQRGPNDGQQGKAGGDQPGGSGYNTEQAISDRAQGATIAYDALAFLTGSLGADSFFPPGKVADFWGFQYLRDNDPSQMGHAGDFLTSASFNMLNILTSEQRARLIALAQSQVTSINEYAYKRFVLMDAFRRLLNNDLPAGTTGLDEAAVKAYSAQLYQLDGQISYARAQMMGGILSSLDATQRAALDSMVGKGMLEWPDVQEPSELRGLDRDTKVAVMTYASDMYSWYAGSVDADVYFCPERHGTYFGSFYLKDRPAMDNSSYAIPTDLTGNMGDALLAALTPDQAKLISSLVEVQKPSLQGIVETRKQVSTELRKFLAGGSADSASVDSLMKQNGELDGAIIYNLATRFVQVSTTLSEEQKAQLMALRKQQLGELLYPSGAYLYSQPIDMPTIPNSDFLFGK